MSAAEYDRRLRAIKSKLREYRPDSVLNMVLDHFHRSGGKENPTMGMPWIVLFLLKLCMLEGHRNGKVINPKEFYKLAQRLYDIQSLACPIQPDAPGDFILKMRAFIAQQAGYQRDTVEEMRALTRQMIWFTGGDDFYSRKFEELYGLSLDSFYYIAFYLVVIVADKAKGVVGLNLLDMLFWLSPRIPIAHIIRFLALVGVKSEDLPSFFEKARIKDECNQQSEYFQPTPLRHKPVLIDGNNFLMFSGSLFSRGMSSIVPDMLKRNLKAEFKQSQFGPAMECYIGSIMAASGVEFISEEEIDKFLSERGVAKGRVTDYLVPGDVNILVESKAIEPGDIVACVADSEVLRSHLSGSFIKGLEQGQETVYRLKKTKEYSDSNFIVVVITHEDFWFSNGLAIAQQVDTTLEERLTARFGSLPIPLADVLYVTIDDFENVLAHQQEGLASMSEVLKLCAERLRTDEGRRFRSGDMLSEILHKRRLGHPSLIARANTWRESFFNDVELNKRAWQGRHIELMESAELLTQKVRWLLK
ncbi:GapS1 family protein [Pseudomonas aeruginosa]